MAWPENGRVVCYGFSEIYLPSLRRLVESGKIQWHGVSLIGSVCTARFSYANCIWELAEMDETVRSICLVNGEIDPLDFTAAVLIGNTNSN